MKGRRQIWEDDDDKADQDEWESMAMCPMGVTCVGGLFSFLFGWMVELLTQSPFFTTLMMALAGAFGISAGMRGSDPCRIKRADFIMMFVAIFVLVEILQIFITCDKMENILLVSVATNTAAGSMRPIMLIPMTVGSSILESIFPSSNLKDFLPEKVTC